MTKNDLMKFCGRENWHAGKYDTPWSDDEFSYASDGWLIVRVPRIIEILIRSGPPVEKLPWHVEPEKWFPVYNGAFNLSNTWIDRVQYGQSWFAKNLLSLILELPNCEIGPIGAMDPARFRFDSGEGIIMPMRPSHI